MCVWSILELGLHCDCVGFASTFVQTVQSKSKVWCHRPYVLHRDETKLYFACSKSHLRQREAKRVRKKNKNKKNRWQNLTREPRPFTYSLSELDCCLGRLVKWGVSQRATGWLYIWSKNVEKVVKHANDVITWTIHMKWQNAILPGAVRLLTLAFMLTCQVNSFYLSYIQNFRTAAYKKHIYRTSTQQSLLGQWVLWQLVESTVKNEC